MASACFLPLLLFILFPLYFLGYLGDSEVPLSTFWILAIYIWVGILVVVIDLWLSDEPQYKKIMWTILNVGGSVFALPVYWLMVIMKRPPPLPSGKRLTRSVEFVAKPTTRRLLNKPVD